MNNLVKLKGKSQIFFVTLSLLLNSTFTYANNNINERDVIEALNSQWNEAFNSGNPAAVAKLYDKDAILSPGNGEVLVGQVAIEGLFRSFIENGVHNHTIEVIDIHHDGKTLYEISKWHAFGVEKEGVQTEYSGILVNIFKINQNGEWKSHSHIWNTKN